ncbi:hypothetical protein JCGZ_23200 [Jatropha curcas]|uniref:Agenet domain-containing protein n=1 Tax=Jatropha curcas TaxID=180498 RepID=A0A067JHM7_JATCU|nr:protein AGENET DOMAIN (AGD)-CONTAINING P1 [Jatropha curcas]KDP23367.1 hypothetical protein JCGZ_23200 [Jatropha curcas]
MASKANNSTPKTPQEPHLKAGSRVEISSDDDGFRGSWYEGTVVRRASSKNGNKYLVQYEKLFSDESGKKPLRETLDCVQLRPAAPREKKRKFKFGEKVDAYHNDGWWEGSITSEREDGRFAVFFRGTREQIVFEEEDLRLHREWVDGEWEPPLKEVQEENEKEEELLEEKQVANENAKSLIATDVRPIEVVLEEKFNKGMLVEVSSDEEGFEGAWYAATIVETVGNNKYLIEYQSLRKEDDSDFLQEEIDASHIRPYPPETILIDRFKLLDEVDASYNDGWWVGVIAKVHADMKYVVYFRDSGEEMVFRHSDLRLHQDWIGGQWIMPSSGVRK